MNKDLMGQLIAEISKFGGADKEKASRLARILLPHIESYVEEERLKAQIEAISSAINISQSALQIKALELQAQLQGLGDNHAV